MTISREVLDWRLLAEVSEDLPSPDALALLQREVTAALAEMQR
jgi:hypothetical protein